MHIINCLIRIVNWRAIVPWLDFIVTFNFYDGCRLPTGPTQNFDCIIFEDGTRSIIFYVPLTVCYFTFYWMNCERMHAVQQQHTLVTDHQSAIVFFLWKLFEFFKNHSGVKAGGNPTLTSHTRCPQPPDIQDDKV